MDTHFRVRNDDVLQVFADQTLKIAGKRLLTLRHQDAHGIYPEMAPQPLTFMPLLNLNLTK